MPEPKFPSPDTTPAPREKHELLPYTFSSASEKAGDHTLNQDQLITFKIPQGQIFVLCDGMGSIQDAQLAGQFLVDGWYDYLTLPDATIPSNHSTAEEIFLDEHPVSGTKNPAHDAQYIFFKQKFLDIYEEWLKDCQERGRNLKNLPGTTMVLAYLEEKNPPRLNVFWVGDSRACLKRDNTVTNLTVDDNAVTEIAFLYQTGVEGAKAMARSVDEGENPAIEYAHFRDMIEAKLPEITNPIMRRWWDSVEYSGSLTSYFGSYRHLPRLNVARVSLQPGDTVYLLTDGVYDNLTPAEIGAHDNAPDLVAASHNPLFPPRYKDDDRTAFVIKF